MLAFLFYFRGAQPPHSAHRAIVSGPLSSTEVRKFGSERVVAITTATLSQIPQLDWDRVMSLFLPVRSGWGWGAPPNSTQLDGASPWLLYVLHRDHRLEPASRQTRHHPSSSLTKNSWALLFYWKNNAKNVAQKNHSGSPLLDPVSPDSASNVGPHQDHHGFQRLLTHVPNHSNS